MCPAVAPLISGDGSWFSRGRMICHCLLIEADVGLILVETGLGTGDIGDPGRLSWAFRASARPRLSLDETALHQIRALGHDPKDVRHIALTHLDVDHAGGLPDFPDAEVHVSLEEHEAAQHRDLRYVPEQIAHGPKWALHRIEGERWFGFDAVSAVPGTDTEVLMIPLAGHSKGHAGVAVRTSDGWLLHVGDAIFHRCQLEGRKPPFGLGLFERFVEHDRSERQANQRRLVELVADHGDEVRVISAHDPVQLLG